MAATKSDVQGKRLTIGLEFPEEATINEVYEFAKNNRIVKVIDSGIFSENSNPTEFGRMLQHLWAVDEVQFTSPYIPKVSTALPSVAYTVPRTGTHVVKEVHGVKDYLHFEHWLTLDYPLLSTLLQSESIVGVARKNLVDTICSKEISKITPGVMLTTVHSHSMLRNTNIVQSLKPIAVDLTRVGDYVVEMANYYGQLMALKIMFGKHVSFSLLDDLAVRKDLIMAKNPYQHSDLILNYKQLCELVAKEHQPVYEYMTNQVIRHCGLALSGVQYPSINNFS